MTNYVVSAPRSGLNWTRYCVEHFVGHPTPGKKLILPNDDASAHAFVRTHDALFMRPDIEEGRAYRKLDPDAMSGNRVLLIVRDPLETFVRSSRKSFDHFACFAGNIRFLVAANAPEKKVVHYEDLVADPDAMFDVMTFFDLAPGHGAQPLAREQVVAQWDQVGEASRRSYQRKQFWGGGAKTRKNPLDFQFHQKNLTAAEKAEVWAYLDKTLSEDEIEILARYRS
ncbi:hypothetical protein JQU17_07565 [Ponticoccus sp. SC2-23]|uniref:hypothetical protein n=1 Tax=Alexandriicola marinus TaxID=2081710 RepID=UPI000FDC6828|nr:hypothetical protein [Alexandriicola marinus]MBM1220455.1 hypothetical protein [Ponticoccus sp. SC6-9]MBM1225141.1 hypothetical protein [Ponticoccus sp. SC6-15]MBM1228655.1 hypothetical protein [Ponticoccus sp. SC6-38]MBM1233708.1 hypothetical protein [Ponticoccus sp. SC6-45]MBM1239156.1 hypothetical protein [Ponticoccus sp. SC6-49]MBM1242938.1 hypothetical protein [Ponticoccus sp. SC2-64]MBM1247232.1 hypothetical protein [Ponticoccus sp. SC6-42]MBM1252109.1 hypothetical protein [Pontico